MKFTFTRREEEQQHLLNQSRVTLAERNQEAALSFSHSQVLKSFVPVLLQCLHWL